MYNQLLYFIIALLLFSIQQPGERPFSSPLETILVGAAIFFLFALICHRVFTRLRNALWSDIPLQVVSSRYHRAQMRLSILALIAVGTYVYGLDIKFYIQRIPGLENSMTLSGVAGLGIYLLHLGVIWYWSYPVYKRIHGSTMSRGAFIKGHFAFNSAILIPWLLISLVSDLLEAVQTPTFLSTEEGEFLLFGSLMVCFVLFAPALVVRLWGCGPLPQSPIREELERFCGKQKFSVGDFLTWPLFGGEMLTAGIVGILPRWRYILMTRGLLALLNIEELKAVVAHEIGHVRRFHLILYLVFLLCYSLLVYSFYDIMVLFLLSHAGVLGLTLRANTNHLTLLSLFYSVPALLLLVFYFRYVFGFFMRNSERQADAYALEVIGHPYTLISSLEKIAVYSGHIHDLPSWHHYSIRERMEFLLDAYRNRRLIRTHNLKLYGSALVLLIGIAGAALTGTYLKQAKVVQLWRTDIEIGIIEHELGKGLSDPLLYAAYGGLLLEVGRFGEAERALLKSHEMAPDNATVLNNLAWLYATAPAPYFNPEEALRLASLAAAKEATPHVLDTLAEAYFVNGRYQEALEAIEKALAMQPANRDYFIKQKEKIEGALKAHSDSA